MTAGTLISAAGGLVWRPDPEPVVCLVHRPRYDDWSIPKGSVKRGEHPLAGAVREVAEETGLRGVPQLPLPATRYRVAGVPKVVEYWAMTATGTQDFHPGSEVDQVAWLPVAEAARRVRYPHDAELLRHWSALPAVTGVVLLVRHAHAGERGGWAGPDRTRPLSADGEASATRLCGLLDLFAPDRLVSATPDRCRQTLAPLAAVRDLPVAADPVFDEDPAENRRDGERPLRNPGSRAPADLAGAAGRLRRLADAGGVTVICTQGAVLPRLLSRLAGERAGGGSGGRNGGDGCGRDGGGAGRRPDWTTDKGDGWLLSFAGPHLLAVAPLRAQRVRQ